VDPAHWDIGLYVSGRGTAVTFFVCFTLLTCSDAEPHHCYAAPVPGKSFDAVARGSVNKPPFFNKQKST
jgi:hypothetical protein